METRAKPSRKKSRPEKLDVDSMHEIELLNHILEVDYQRLKAIPFEKARKALAELEHNANLTGVNLSYAELTRCNLSYVNLSTAP